MVPHTFGAGADGQDRHRLLDNLQLPRNTVNSWTRTSIPSFTIVVAATSWAVPPLVVRHKWCCFEKKNSVQRKDVQNYMYVVGLVALKHHVIQFGYACFHNEVWTWNVIGLLLEQENRVLDRVDQDIPSPSLIERSLFCQNQPIPPSKSSQS